MKIYQDSDAPEVRIEIVPLIDVIFCILTFFILAAVGLTRQEGIGVNLPKASTGAAQMREMLVVSLDPTGQTFVEKQPVSREQLYQTISRYHKAKPSGLIALSAAQTVSYNQVIEILDLLRSVGGDRVALTTFPTDRPNLSPQNPPQNPAAPLPFPAAPGGQLEQSPSPLNPDARETPSQADSPTSENGDDSP